MALFLQSWFRPNPNHPGAFMLRVYTYVRRAQANPRGEEDPFAAQVAQHPDHTLVGAFDDLGLSGLTAPQDRPGFQALLAAHTREPAEILLIPAVHHLSRDRRTLAARFSWLSRLGLAVLIGEQLSSSMLQISGDQP